MNMTEINEEEKNSVKEKIINYIKKNNFTLNISNISINIEKCKACLNNDNYIVIIKDKESQKTLIELFLKVFRNKKDNKKLESEVQRILGEKNLGPKLLEMNDEEKYKIDEYLPNLNYIKLDYCLKDNIIDKILEIIICFNNLYHLYFYNIDDNHKIIYNENKSLINPNINNISIDFNNNSFYQHINIYLPKAELVLNKFIESYNLNKNIVNIDEKLGKLKYIVDNYKTLLIDNVYKHCGYFVFSHSDFHRGNVVHIGNNLDKLYVLDIDFINLNLIGYDLIYYLIKSVFKNGNGIVENYLNLTNFYKIYLKYINKFLDEFEGFKTENDKDKIDEIKNYIKNDISSKEYFIRLIKLVLYFDIIYCCDLINFENEFLSDKSFKFFNYLSLNIDILDKIENDNINDI